MGGERVSNADALWPVIVQGAWTTIVHHGDIMIRRTFVCLSLVALFGCAPGAPDGEVMTTWYLGDAEVRIDGGAEPIFRVRGASFLPGGSIIVADAGNFRLAVFDRDGTLTATLGSRGEGPGEFASISRLGVVGDTIMVHDPALNRMTLWTSFDAEATTVWLPTHRGLGTTPEAQLSGAEVLLLTIEPPPVRRETLFVDSTDVLRFNALTGDLAFIQRDAQRYLYFYVEDRGATSYRTPFFGKALRTAVAGQVLTAPLDSAALWVQSAAGDRVGTVDLGIGSHPFDRRTIDAFKDSLLAIVGGGATADRIRAAYEAIEPPPSAPRVRRLVTVGERVWVEAFPEFEATENTWLVADPVAQELVATIELPRSITPLGGLGTSVLFLERDALDVETVTVRTVGPA